MTLTHNQHKWFCSCCGKEMQGLPPAFGFRVPDHWLELDARSKKASKINDDFCLIKKPDGSKARYIRCIMKMPLIIGIGKSEEFQFGVWMSVSERSWNIYWDGYDDESYAEDGCFGYLSNTISVYPDSFNLPGDVYFQNEGFRPMVVLHNGSHRLALDQQAGMPVEVVERLMENREH